MKKRVGLVIGVLAVTSIASADIPSAFTCKGVALLPPHGTFNCTITIDPKDMSLLNAPRVGEIGSEYAYSGTETVSCGPGSPSFMNQTMALFQSPYKNPQDVTDMQKIIANPPWAFANAGDLQVSPSQASSIASVTGYIAEKSEGITYGIDQLIDSSGATLGYYVGGPIQIGCLK